MRFLNQNFYEKNFGYAKKFIRRYAPSWVKFALGIYPVTLRSEKKALIGVLHKGEWNMSYGAKPIHQQLEIEFAKFVGAEHAVAVGGGGMGLQMALRSLGLERDSEVLMQVDTCSAVAQSALNAQTIPRFFDADPDTFLSNIPSVESKINRNTKAIVASHLWGNPDNTAELKNLADRTNTLLIEDSCLALGTLVGDKHIGTNGKVGIFSFGSTKPIQAGEGGLIVTDDVSLAKELRAMRHWGERTKDFGVRDIENLSWNGRMSEFSAAVALEQLRGFSRHIEKIRDNVKLLEHFLNNNSNLGKLNIGNASKMEECSFTQAILTLNFSNPSEKTQLFEHLSKNNIQVFHANFEPIPTLSFFKNGKWEKWINRPTWDPRDELLESKFPSSYEIYRFRGLGLSRVNFQSKFMTQKLITALKLFEVKR